MRSISLTALFLCCIAMVACSKPSASATAPKPAKYAAMVTLVDSIPVPVPDTMLGPDMSGDAQDGPSIKLSSPPADIPGDLTITLLGPQQKPVALTIYSTKDIQTYYVPFKGVTTIDRPRRLTKLADRVYQIESNRTTKGVLVEKQLP
ncbi:MAG: hypothetical protein EOP83_06760 [Verrucomicrobiaceae bacterium]|nr:MAG: hypothetical protein EOP83_06760 [Verrucomicrobiaceae bacterium]